MWYHFSNLRAEWKFYEEKLKKFYADQEQWMRAMIKNHSSADGELGVFWRHVEYIVFQYDGLYAGYKAATEPDWVTRS